MRNLALERASRISFLTMAVNIAGLLRINLDLKGVMAPDTVANHAAA